MASVLPSTQERYMRLLSCKMGMTLRQYPYSCPVDLAGSLLSKKMEGLLILIPAAQLLCAAM